MVINWKTTLMDSLFGDSISRLDSSPYSHKSSELPGRSCIQCRVSQRRFPSSTCSFTWLIIFQSTWLSPSNHTFRQPRIQICWRAIRRPRASPSNDVCILINETLDELQFGNKYLCLIWFSCWCWNDFLWFRRKQNSPELPGSVSSAHLLSHQRNHYSFHVLWWCTNVHFETRFERCWALRSFWVQVDMAIGISY